MAFETVEDFFLNRIDCGRIFEAMERSEYLLLYNIEKSIEESGQDRVYISDLAGSLKLTITETSRAVKNLEDRGYVTWHTDENKERTYVQTTVKAKEALKKQNERMERAYSRIVAEISEDELFQTVTTLGKIREIMRQTGSVRT